MDSNNRKSHKHPSTSSIQGIDESSLESHKLSRRTFIGSSILTGLGLAIGFPAFSSPLFKKKNGKKKFSFVFFTDSHVQPELKAPEGFEMAVKKINSLEPDFVVSGGDLIMDALGQNYEKANMLYDLYNQVSSKFKMPLYNTIGNHEHFGVYEKSGVDISNPLYGKKMFMERIGKGKTYQSLDYEGWHFILLDSIGITEDRKYIGEVSQDQMKWLEDDLKKTGEKTPIVISTHIPFFSTITQFEKGPCEPNSRALVITNGHEVAKLFYPYNVKLMLQGHLHLQEEWLYKSKHFLTTGALCGAWWKGPQRDFPEGFTFINCYENSFDFEYMTYGWKAVERPRKEISAPYDPDEDYSVCEVENNKILINV